MILLGNPKAGRVAVGPKAGSEVGGRGTAGAQEGTAGCGVDLAACCTFQAAAAVQGTVQAGAGGLSLGGTAVQRAAGRRGLGDADVQAAAGEPCLGCAA